MEFRILGPLEARVDGRVLPLGGAKQRALLALLLLHRNEVVSTDRLIDGLWGEQPPATAAEGRPGLRLAASEAPRAVGAGRRRLVTRPPGYVLELAPDELDLDRFEQLVEEARRASASGDPAAASAALAPGARHVARAAAGGPGLRALRPGGAPLAWRSSGWRRSRAASRPTSPSAAHPS